MWKQLPECIYIRIESAEVAMPPLKSYSIHHEFNANANCHNGNENTTTDNDNDYFSQSAAAAAASTQRTNLPSYCNAQYPFKVLANLNQLREQSRFCDVEIIAGEATVNAHRAVLSAASAYFEAMFRPELGLNEVKQKSVVLHTIDGDILQILLDFIYTGRCEITQVNKINPISLGLFYLFAIICTFSPMCKNCSLLRICCNWMKLLMAAASFSAGSYMLQMRWAFYASQKLTIANLWLQAPWTLCKPTSQR